MNRWTVDAFGRFKSLCQCNCQNELGTQKKKALSNILKIDDPRNFQTKVAIDQLEKLEKPIAAFILKFKIRNNTIAECFIVLKQINKAIIGLHFVSNNSVVIDTTQSLKHFPKLTIEVKTASIETIAKPQLVSSEDALTIPTRQQKRSQPLSTSF